MSSRLLDGLVRSATIFIIISGMLVLTWWLFSSVDSFSTDLTKLEQFAGSGVVFSSTLDLLQNQILVMLGLAAHPAADEEGVLVLETGSLYATATPQFTSAAGFIPYQVEVSQTPQDSPTLLPPIIAPPQATPFPSAIPLPAAVPDRIVIPRIGLDAPIIVSHTKMVLVGEKAFVQWEAPNLNAVGWQEESALLGEPGNTVLNGHHNVYGEIFARLYELEQYDEIVLHSGDREFHYLVSQVMKIKERDVSLEQRQENARWIMHSADERLTLVTCWPPTSNTYRLIVVAVPFK